MKILAIDSSGLPASAAILEDDALTAEFFVNYKLTHSQTLLPMIQQIVKMASLDLKTLDYVAITGGPGSFTGLRIGSSTAKGIAGVLGIPIVSVPTVDAMAWSLWGRAGLVAPLMDARRGQAYTGIYEFDENGEMKVHLTGQPMAVSDLVEMLNGMGRRVTFMGDLTEDFRKVIQDNARIEYSFAPPHMRHQRAAAAGSLSLLYIARGEYTTADEHVPVYMRMAQAERDRQLKGGREGE